MRRLTTFLLAVLLTFAATHAQSQDAPLQALLQQHAGDVAKPSRRTVDAIVEALLAAELPGVSDFLVRWRDKEVWHHGESGLFYYVKEQADDLTLIDIDTGKEAGTAAKRDLAQIRPNSGVRSVLSSALVRFQLSDPDPAKRLEALVAIERDPDAAQLEPLRAAIGDEPDAAIGARKQRLERLLTIRFGASAQERIEAISGFRGDTAIDVRAALNPLLATVMKVAKEVPESDNLARTVGVSGDLGADPAYQMLVDAGLAPQRISDAARDQALVANAVDGMVEGIVLSSLDTTEKRDDAYRKLVEAGRAPPFVPLAERERLLSEHTFYEAYAEPDSTVTDAAVATLNSINRVVGLNRLADLALDALSLASLYFLAAIGLAITFGVMGVINMAHGEFIMMGAYTGYVVQQFIDDYTLSIAVALPLAFIVTFAAGVVMERLVIRHLMHRPLETLLATFGISIALQQLAKNIFGTQARPLTAPSWLDGSLVFNDIVAISYIRIAIFVLAAIFLVLLLFILNRTRLGLEVRAVTQNPRMASSMGINPDRINMLTFGLGSGIAGIAGVAIGLFAQVTSELGSNYIVQSFMTVVVGGVGNIWGTLAGAGMIGSLQKVIELFNPSNTLAAQTYMIIFIIIFIQFRPKGIIALKGRAAGD